MKTEISQAIEYYKTHAYSMQEVAKMFNIDRKTLSGKDGKEIELGSGMSVTAEIKTGERSVISYLLSPLEESISESLRER